MTTDAQAWRALCGKAVQLVGSQAAFRKEANVLKRLVKSYGADEVTDMIAGAQRLGWTSLLGLGSADGLGRRWALEAFWQSQNSRKAVLPETLSSILRKAITGNNP